MDALVSVDVQEVAAEIAARGFCAGNLGRETRLDFGGQAAFGDRPRRHRLAGNSIRAWLTACARRLLDHRHLAPALRAAKECVDIAGAALGMSDGVDQAHCAL